MTRNSNRTVWRHMAACLAMAMTAAFATGCSPDAQKPPEKSGVITLTKAQLRHIHLYTVAPLAFHKSVMADGVVDFDQEHSVHIISPITGPVTRLIAAPGQTVRKGAPLAEVSSADFAAAVSGYRKGLAAAATARRLADMDKDILAHHGISQREADQAESDAVGAEADRDAALQALESLGVDGATLKAIRDGRPVSRIAGVIRAPMDGTVVERLVTPGQLLQAGTTPTFTIADLSRMWVMARVFGDDLNMIAVGDKAVITAGPGGAVFTGRVDNIAAAVDPDTRAVTVRIVAANPRRMLLGHMYVQARIIARRQSTGLLVPDSAVLRDSENLPFVYLARPDGGFVRRSVTPGYRDGNRYVISHGLGAGDRVVVDGAIFLNFMQSQ